jgi:uncharacterized repeat protein (TIGR01451 family)
MRVASQTRGRVVAAVALSVSIVASSVAVLLPTAAAQVATSATITSAGPLTSVTISDDLNCDVRHTGDTAPEFFGATACATLVVVNGTLYGPLTIPAGTGASPRTTYTPVSQTGPTGSGTDADPYRIVTVVDAGTSGVRLTQTDTYVVGSESYRTDIALSRTAAVSNPAVRLYRAGDCFLQDSDQGFGAVDPTTGAVACTASNEEGSRVIQFLPITAGSNYLESQFNTVWATIGAQGAFPNTCLCGSFVDNGAGLQWDSTVPATGSATVSSIITFSPTGVTPFTTAKTADAASTAPGGTNGYTITLHNPNPGVAVLDSVFDDLPAGFSYRNGTTTGLTTANPSVDSETGVLTWNGPFNVPGESDVSLHFGVNVATTAGTYTNEAGGTSDATVAPTGPTAPVTINAPALSVTNVDEPDPVTSGNSVRYTVTITNTGSSAAHNVVLADTLPSGTTFVSSTPSQGTCAAPASGIVNCALGTINGGSNANVRFVVTTGASFVGTKTNRASVTSTEQPTPVVVNQSTQVVAPTPGTATGYVPPGGSISNGAVASPANNTVARFTLPNTGTGAPISLVATGGATYCAGACSGKSTFLSPFVGYEDPNKPAVLTIRWDKSVVGRGLHSKIYELKDGQTTATVVPECANDPRWTKAEKFFHTILRLLGLGPWGTRAVPSPCVNKRFFTPDGDLAVEILVLSGDPSFGKR